MANKVAVITGANSGIGLALAHRILGDNALTKIILVCRNQKKALAAKKDLLKKHPEADLPIILIDVGNQESVYKGIEEIKKSVKRIDYMFLNAGIMPVSTIDWGNFCKGFFSKNCIHMFATGDGLLKQIDETNEDGMKQIFATNLFGHYIMISELEELLGGAENSSIIWTSSNNAKKEAFSLDDIQHTKGLEPYASSKYAVDSLSVALNKKLNQKGIYSHTTCPGLVMTNLTFNIMPSFFWYLMFPFLWLMRLLTHTMTITPYNGSWVLYWLYKEAPEKLDPLSKYLSRANVVGKVYTKSKPLDVNPDDADKILEALESLKKATKPKLTSVTSELFFST